MKKLISVFTSVAVIAAFCFITPIFAANEQITNASGEANFLDIPLGEYEITVTRDGFYSKTTTAEIIATESGKDMLVNVELDPITGGTVVIGNGIKDEGGNPVYDANVLVDGSANLDNLSEGTHTVTITKPGYYDEEFEIDILFVEGDEIYNLDVTLRPILDGTATITINDGTNPVSGVTVTIDGVNVDTGVDGKAVFSNLPVGVYSVSAYKDGYLSATGSVSIVAMDGQQDVDVSISLTEITSGSLRVVVTDNGGTPITGAEVELRIKN